MTRLLTKRLFTEADLALPEIQSFHCGDERWDREVAGWIKSASGGNSVVEDMRRFGTEVWLYRDDQGELVGFSSLGQTTYTWPVGSKRKERVQVIPFIGVHAKFKGEPKDAKRDDKYAYQILDDLLACAAEKALSGGLFALLVLSVDDQNKRAIRFYENRDFFDLKIPRVDTAAGITYMRMARYLDDLVAQLREEQDETSGDPPTGA
jgi:ribosomal protein S18 acetylase RimI-like enzyme